MPSVAERTNRRRLRVFLGTLSVALALSLAFTWLRPAEYRSAAMLEILPGAETAGARSGAPRITPGSESPSSRSGARSASESAKPFLTEVQILTSRPVLETVVTRLRRDGRDVSAFGVDPAAGMQSRLEAIPTHVLRDHHARLPAVRSRAAEMPPSPEALRASTSPASGRGKPRDFVENWHQTQRNSARIWNATLRDPDTRRDMRPDAAAAVAAFALTSISARMRKFPRCRAHRRFEREPGPTH